MAQYGKWKPIRLLGVGGQGSVYLAHDSERFDPDLLRSQIGRFVLDLSPTSYRDVQPELAGKLADAILKYGQCEDSANVGALKVLLETDDSKNYEKQLERMKREVSALALVSHPAAIQILDQRLEERWFVMKYYPLGPLSDHLNLYQGDILRALEAFYPLVEAVAQIHNKGLVHRDIKPENIFLDENGALVLGDFGLVFFDTGHGHRITETFENVGSRDWMPLWATGMRLEDVKPSFDVFSLGKLFWSMLSGKRRLQLWYHHKPQFELEQMFPHDHEIRWARLVLDPCIVEEEKDCMGSANELLTRLRWVLRAVRRHSQVVGEKVVRLCRVCGLGYYERIVNEELSSVRNFGLNPAGTGTFKIFRCNHCGHTDLFHLRSRESKPPAWE